MNATIDRESLRDAEWRAARDLEPQLRDHLTLTINAFNAIGMTLEYVPRSTVAELSASLRVALKLLLRLANDMHCAEELALRGYPLQAATLIASVYEVAFTIAFIGDDDRLAQQWVDHDDPTYPFRSAKEMTRRVFEKREIPNIEIQTGKFFRVYRQLCLAKHANPLLQSRFGVDVRTDVVVHSNGPDTSERAVQVAWFALQHAAGLVCIALVDFYESHLHKYCDSDMLTALRQALDAIGADRERLEAAAVARWGADDPFPGRW
jgi:hypothetical protein